MLEVQDLDREDQQAVAAAAADAGESVVEGEAVEEDASCAKGVGKGPVDLMWKRRPV